MSDFIDGARTVIGLELRQRVRGIAWAVLLGITFLVLLLVTVLAQAAAGGGAFGWSGPNSGAGSMVYSVVTYVVLLMATLVSPALSGNAINGDRDAATLAPVQVTLLSTGQIVIGKFLAAWITALAFLAVAAPFMLFAALSGGLAPITVLASLAVLVVEVGVIAAIGVGLSGIIGKPLFSVVTTYLVVAALSIGTLIAFGLGGAAIQTPGTSSYRDIEYNQVTGEPTTDPVTCTPWTTEDRSVPRFDLVWGFLAANPYVILADATPVTYTNEGYPRDLFGQIGYGVRITQKTPEIDVVYDGCAQNEPVEDYPSAREQIEGTVPSWFVGLGIHILLAAGAIAWAWSRTRTPAGRLPRGTRIA